VKQKIYRGKFCPPLKLSVSSNGSTWVKQHFTALSKRGKVPFSILERIDVGETWWVGAPGVRGCRLSVSSNGSTWVKRRGCEAHGGIEALSVSSNGSTWVKPISAPQKRQKK